MWNGSTAALARAYTRLLVFTLATGVVSPICSGIPAAETKAPLIFSGGHETDPQDHGRPVVLLAAALGVTPEVFREAFRGVTPARGGKPSPEQARPNKEALMKVLKPHGVTNERLDEVSNFYRYQPQRGQLWKTTTAEGHGVVENGKVKRIVLTESGSGYSTPPQVHMRGLQSIALEVTLHFDKDLKKNGSVGTVEPGSVKPRLGVVEVGAAPTQADEPGDRARLRAVLLEREKEGWEMLRKKDVAAMRDYFLDDAVLIFRDGTRFSKAEFLKITPDFDLASYTIEGKVDILFLTPDAATLIYRITYTSALKQKKPQTVTVLASSTYVRRGGKWLYMFYQETPAK